MRWFRAYYDDESTYEGPHEMAPKTGIQTIIQENPRCGFEQLDGSHYYVLKGDRWFTAPVAVPQGLYFPGFKAEDASGDMLPGIIAYWFAWYAFHPDTRVYRAE